MALHPRAAAFVVAGLGVGLLAADQGGYFPRTWPWAALAFAAVAALTFLTAPELRPPRSGLVLVGGLAGLTAWTASSALWSLEPATSLREAERGLVYVTAALALTLLAAAAGAPALLLGLVAGVVGIAGWSLTDRALHGPHAVDRQQSMLARPLGYANALGALCAIALVIVLTFAVSRRSRGERLLALATAAPLVAALALTRSRGSFVAATAGLVVAFALLAGGRRWAMFAATLVAVGLAGLGVVAAFTTPDSLQARGDYWHVAWHVVRAHPLLGTGAGTYDLAWGAYGDIGRWGGALDAHSLYLESLAELGPVGLVLLGALLVPLVSVLRADRPSTASAAALGGAVTFLVHAGLDWDWEMPAVTLAGLVCLAAAIASRRERGASFRSATASTKAKGLSSDLRPGEAR